MYKNKKQKMNKTLFKKIAAKSVEIGIGAGFGHAIAKSSDNKKIEQAQLSHQELSDKLDNIQNSVDKVHEAIKSIPSLNSNSNNKLIFDFNLDSFYSYLDSLTLAQELALIHILFAILYLLIAFEFFSIFFGNEIINYFDLENKYPRIAIFLKYRNKFQKYFIYWNVLLIFV